MSKALTFMLMGALCSGTAYYYMRHKEDVSHAMHKFKRSGMRTMNRFKAMI